MERLKAMQDNEELAGLATASSYIRPTMKEKTRT
jgi:hypothetical protein